MPLPNGVSPMGEIQPTCPSATWMGNRGILHNALGRIHRQWDRKAWVTCALHFKGRNRKPLMQPNRYSELFFLDEATAFAAGHRPRGECRRDDYARFKAAWLSVTREDWKQVDAILHQERVDADRSKRVSRVQLRDLPNGAMFRFEGDCYLKWRDSPARWSPTGYRNPDRSLPPTLQVDSLTPASLVEMLRMGYSVQVHSSIT
jgi:hypothetical protein